jgi:hypothetical protein
MRVGAFLPTVALALLAAGCASSVTQGTIGDWYAVVSPETSFYHHGPQQGSGPDSQLTKGSIMKVIRPSFGYVKVQLQDGENGYVANEDIGPAPSTLVKEKLEPPPPPPPPPVLASQGEQFDLNSDDPRLIAPPEPLPEPTVIPENRN